MTDTVVGAPPPSTLPSPGDPLPPPPTQVGGGAGGEGRGGGWRREDEEEVRRAASEGEADRVRQLLQAGVSVQPDQEGRTALHFAAQNGHAEVCKLLVQHDGALDLQDTMGYTALLRASSQGTVEVVKVLLEAGCAVDFADNHKNTALHEAAWHGFSQTVQLLVKYNADVFRVNQSGFTALHLAAQNGHNETCRVLLYGGINPDLQNNYGDTALHTAARYGHAGVTRILISARCKLNMPNKNGDTALHIAAALKRRKITKILMESAVDIHIRNKQNETAVDVARRKEHPEIILLITSVSRPRSAGPKTRDVLGVTFKDDLEDKGPVVRADDEPSIKPEKQEKERRLFPFFRRKKKDKDKEQRSVSPRPVTRIGSGGSGGKVQPVPPKPVSGFFSQYVPRSGTQYYRDLAGNIKQGPVGYIPLCQCGPALHHIEKSMHHTKELLYQHIDASHQVLQDRIEQLDLRTSQQAHSIDRLTHERLEEERRVHRSALEERLQRERHHTQYVVESYGEDLQGHIQDWLEDRLASYGHCLDHHHDDLALPSSRVFTDIHLGPDGGRLFRSRSDETLSVSDYSGKGRKRHFYESRKAAMEQIRGWKVPTGNRESSTRKRERGRSADNLDRREGRGRGDRTRGHGDPTGEVANVGEVHRTADSQPDGVSPSHGAWGGSRSQQWKEKQVGFSPREEHAPSQGALPKRSSLYQSHTRLQSQSRQSRSHGNLPSHAPIQPLSSQPHGGQRPPRGILRSHTHDATLHAATFSQQQPNLEERGPRGHSSGPEPGEHEDPCCSQPTATGPAGHAGSAEKLRGVYGASQPWLHADQRVAVSSHAKDVHHFRPRTRSMDTMLDDVDGIWNGGHLRQSEERDVGTRQDCRAENEREPSGYGTDSGQRRDSVQCSPHNYLPYKRQAENGSVPPLFQQRDPDSGMSSHTRPVSKKRGSGYFTDSEIGRAPGDQRSADMKPSLHPSPSKQQNLNPHQPVPHYRVMPPLPTTRPFTERTKPQVAPKPVPPSRVENQGVCNRGDNRGAWDRTGSQPGSAKELSTADKTIIGGHVRPQDSSSRTPSLSGSPAGSLVPHQNRAGSTSKAVGPSQGTGVKNWARTSPRDSRLVSSGHYSVSKGCVQHDDDTDSRLSAGNSKEPSTCSSNQDSGYIDHHPPHSQGQGGAGRGGDSTTPSSSFSMDRSSLGTPSSASSPYTPMGGHSYSNYISMGDPSTLKTSEGPHPQSYTTSSFTSPKPGPNNQGHLSTGSGRRDSPSVVPRQEAVPSTTLLSHTTRKGSHQSEGAGSGVAKWGEKGREGDGGRKLIQRQVEDWYQQRLLEAARRLRTSEHYTPSAHTSPQGDGWDRSYTQSSDGYNKRWTHTGGSYDRLYAPSGDGDKQQNAVAGEPSDQQGARSMGLTASAGEIIQQCTVRGDCGSQFAVPQNTYRQKVHPADYALYTPPQDSYSKGCGQSMDSSKQYGQSVDSYKQYGQSIDTSKQYGQSIDTSKQYGQSIDTSKQYGQSIDNSRQYGHSADSSWQYGQSVDSNKQYKQSVDNSSRQYGQSINSSGQYEQSVNSSRQYVNSSKQYGQSVDSSRQYGQSIDSSTQYGQYVNSSKQYGQSVDSSRQYGQSFDSSTQYGQYVNSSKQYGQSVDSSRQYGQSFDSSRQSFDSSRQYERSIDSSRQYGQSVDSSRQYGQSIDSSRQYGQSFDSSRQYGQSVDSSRQYGQSINSINHPHQSSVDKGLPSQCGRWAESSDRQHGQHKEVGYNRLYGQSMNGAIRPAVSGADNYYGSYTTVPIRYDPVNGSDV